MRSSAIGLIAALIASGCASPPAAPVTVLVQNRSTADIEAIHMKECEGDEGALAPVPETELHAGRSLTIHVPASCIDLVAFDRRGRVAAEQRALRALPGTTWSIY